MKKFFVVAVLAMVLCLGLAASVWAADMPGQKLTDAEASSVRGMGFSIPMNMLSMNGCTIIVNGARQFYPMAATPTGGTGNTGAQTFGGVTVQASYTFTR